MKETELKSLIDFDTYTKIKNTLNWDSVFEQENNYYTDRGGILRENRIMVRIRVTNGIRKIQVKLHKNAGSPLQICEENEFDINGIPETLDAETALKITGLDVGELCKLGAAVTKRRTLTEGTSELCLDKTTYFGKTDYEVEVEYTGDVNKELLSLLDSFGVKFDKKSTGKFSRFLKERMAQGGL